MRSVQKKQRNPVQKIVAHFLPWLKTEQPSIVEYVEQAKFEGPDRKLRQWPHFENGHSASRFCNAWLAATLGAGMVTLGSAIGCNTNKTSCNHGFLVNTSQVTAAIGVLSATMVSLCADGHKISYGTLFSLTRRRKRGEQEAKRNFDGILTDNDVLNGVTLLPAMQRFDAARKPIENSRDFAALAFVKTGDKIVNGIVSQFEKDQSGILQAANDSLKYYNDFPADEDNTKVFTALAAKFADPKFIGALALGIFNGDVHQDLVEALKQYGDEDKLHKALVYLCTNATIVVDVINKLQQRIPDALPKNIKECRERLEIRRNNLIKSYPEIAGGFGLELIPDADIDAVNAAFAALDISGVVHLPSQANDDNRAAQLEARFAALEAGAAAARAALPEQQPPLKFGLTQLEEGVHERRGGGR